MKTIFLILVLGLFFFLEGGGNQQAFAAQTWYFKWNCINVSGCRANGIPASKTEGPYGSQSQCNSARNQMTSGSGFRVQGCYSAGSASTTTNPSQPPAQKQPTAKEMAPHKVITIPDGKELYSYCGAAQGLLKGSTREWYLGCCPRAYRILKSPSPTIPCGTEEARKNGIECACYKEVKHCMQDGDNAGMCY